MDKQLQQRLRSVQEQLTARTVDLQQLEQRLLDSEQARTTMDEKSATRRAEWTEQRR